MTIYKIILFFSVECIIKFIFLLINFSDTFY